MTHYAVLYGERGVKTYKTKSMAIRSAKRVIKKGRHSLVEVDKITTYPKARVGMVDWSQHTIRTFKKRKR